MIWNKCVVDIDASRESVRIVEKLNRWIEKWGRIYFGENFLNKLKKSNWRIYFVFDTDLIQKVWLENTNRQNNLSQGSPNSRPTTDDACTSLTVRITLKAKKNIYCQFSIELFQELVSQIWSDIFIWPDFRLP